MNKTNEEKQINAKELAELKQELAEHGTKQVPTLANLKKASNINYDEFEGCKAKIEEVQFLEMPSKFVYLKNDDGSFKLDKDGNKQRDPDGKQWTIKIITEAIQTLPARGDQENDFELRASEIFNVSPIGNGNFEWGDTSNLGKFMKRLKIEEAEELIGKLVTLRQFTKNNKNGEEKTYLGFIKE